MNRYDLIMDREPVSTGSEKSCCKTDLVFEKKNISILQARCGVCGDYQSRIESSVLFKTINESSDWNCTACGSKVHGTTVFHPIHGSGKVYNEYVPYCPKCEEKPNSSGSFILGTFKTR